MLSVANVRSASGAASYFAADNYYASADADRSGQWVGSGAAALGLSGEVDAAVFDKLLKGELPGGTRVGHENQHRAGTDLTFSLPKSWSVLALVGGDKRIIEAYREAVIETLRWAEKNAAETRLVENGKVRTVQTGNLTVALFQHDTNRNQEPSLHFHAVIANATKGADGKWRTLKNDRLWSLNTLLNSMTMARFRLSVEKLGYAVGPVGKHGNFEAAGFTREHVMAFKAVAAINHGIDLNAGQETAARLILSSTHRTIAIQGVAGAGKSSVLKPVAQILGEEGKEIIGLAVQNTLVQMLERDTGITSMTLARLLKSWAPLLEDPGNVGLQAEAKDALGDRVLVLDEASMVSNHDKERLVTLGNLVGVRRLVLVGDTRQLGAVDAGKPFDLIQKAGIERADMTTNLRGRDPQLRLAQAAAQSGDVHTALGHLKGSTIETRGDSALVAAEQWLALAPQDRDRTAIYASGRLLRSAVNDAVQRGLKANGELGKTPLELTVLSRVNATREELRYLSAYRPGMVLDVRSPDKQQHLPRGEYKVESIDDKSREVRLRDAKGRMRTLRPSRIRPGEKDDRLALFEEKRLSVHDGDRIRWTENDHRRGLFNADQARIEAVKGARVTLVTSSGLRHELERGDPMLRRLDLAYALNAHMAQGLTSDRGIAVMDSRERNLANQQTFLVTVTRLRDHLTLVVDSADKLGKAVAHNTGEKTSALEVTERLREAAAKGLAAGTATKEDQSKQPPELAKERNKPFEIGI